MKKYNRLIVLSVMLYLLAALGIADASYRETAEREKAYKVEITVSTAAYPGGFLWISLICVLINMSAR